jgi:predicted aspartyl protease/tetratricopeptide (TPR) repeat protein
MILIFTDKFLKAARSGHESVFHAQGCSQVRSKTAMTTTSKTGLLALTALCGLLGAAGQASAASACRAVNYGTLPVEMVGGRATTMAKINGKDTRFIIDTGAFYNTMPRATAEALGLHLEMAPQGFYITGLGGSMGVSLTRVKEFGILDAKLPNITFIVGGSDMGMGLLGAPLLDLFDLEADLAAGKMTIMKPTGCSNAVMAYWSPGNYNEAKLLSPEGTYDRKSRVTVLVNGKPVKALLDTGAHTAITRKAALRVGIDMSKAEAGGDGGGIGSHHYQTWIARVDSYSVGTETIQNSKMRIMDSDIGDGPNPDEMLLGADFFLSHHIYIANSQRKIYFTYNGGRVSQLDRQGAVNAPRAGDAATGGEPKTAQDYGLRGQARLERGEVAGGIGDLTKAIALAPEEPSSAVFYYARARGRMSNEKQVAGQSARVAATAVDAALADLDMALRLAPDMPDPLVMRAQLRMLHRETDLARADIDTLVRVVPMGGAQTQTLAGLLIATDQPARALPLLDGWVKLHQDDTNMGEMLNMRCWTRGLAGTALEGAQEDCRKAIRRNGDQAAYLDSQALVELRLGHNQAALDDYTKALAKNPDMAWSRYGMAVARLRLGQVEQGKAQLAAVKASDPDVVARAARFGLTPP